VSAYAEVTGLAGAAVLESQGPVSNELGAGQPITDVPGLGIGQRWG
jgi:hypothetical protein